MNDRQPGLGQIAAPGPKTMTFSMPSSQKPDAARMAAAVESYRKLIRGRPESGKESSDYAVAMTEALAHLTPEEHGWLTDPRDGLATVCKYLPTVADVHEFLRNKRAKQEQFKPAHTSWKRLGDEHGPWDLESDADRKKRVVREALGYDPENRQAPAQRELVPPSVDDVSNLKLRTPPKPISRELRDLLERDGWPFIPGQGEA